MFMSSSLELMKPKHDTLERSKSQTLDTSERPRTGRLWRKNPSLTQIDLVNQSRPIVLRRTSQSSSEESIKEESTTIEIYTSVSVSKIKQKFMDQ